MAVRHLGDDLGQDLLNVGDIRNIALPRVKRRRHGEVAEFGEPAADILDVLMDAEDLLHDQHGRERPAARRHGAIGGDAAVGDRDLDLAGLEPGGIGGYHRLRHDRVGGKREAARETCHDEAATREIGFGNETLDLRF